MVKVQTCRPLMREIWQARYLYLLVLPVALWIAVFSYGPMYGLLLAFKDYSARLGILGSEWVGLKHFRRIFSSPDAIRAIRNTLLISTGRLALEFPVPIAIAILLNEMPGRRLKRVYQTVLTFPHFLSWIVVSLILSNFLSNDGAINTMLSRMGMEKVRFFASKPLFVPLLFLTQNWKEMGWSAIIYMAAIAGVNPSLYEAATVDGASRLRQIWHVTLPGIRSTIIVLFILQVGNVMNAGFEQIFTLRNPVVSSVAQVLDTYIYDITFMARPNYGFSTAVGLFKALINVLLLLTANQVVAKLSDEKVFG